MTPPVQVRLGKGGSSVTVDALLLLLLLQLFVGWRHVIRLLVLLLQQWDLPMHLLYQGRVR